MYASWANQLYEMAHYFLAGMVAYVWLPGLLFRPVNGTRGDRLWANWMRMVMFVIVVGYLLVITKLMEVIGFAVVVAAWMMVRRGRQAKHAPRPRGVAMAIMYDMLELNRLFRIWWQRIVVFFRGRLARNVRSRLRLNPKILLWVVGITIFAISAYIRLDNAWTNAAPAMSDGDTTLAWLKYVNERILFHDGIYPQGEYFYMDVLLKLSFINPLYVVNYAGPLDTLLVVVGLFYVIRRLTGSVTGALVAAGLYGVFVHQLLYDDWTRQAASDAQEFGFAFVLPTLWFFFRYLDSGERTDLGVAFAGLCANGLTHALSYVLVVAGAASLFGAVWLVKGNASLRRIGLCVLAGAASGLVALGPLGLGRMFGRNLNSSASAFASATASSAVVLPPHLHWSSYAALTAILVLAVYAVVQLLRGGDEVVWLFGAFFGAGIFISYYFGGPVTHNEVLISRDIDLWGVVMPLVIGTAVALLANKLAAAGIGVVWQGCALVAALGVGLWLSPPTPMIPYKLQWNDEVEAYLKIDRAYRFTSYMIVAPQLEYALVLGDGYLLGWNQLVNGYNPAAPPLTRYGQHHIDTNLNSNVFVYVPKSIFEVSKSNSVYALEAPIYRQEQRQLVALHQWLAAYQRAHGKLQVFYSSPHLTVYYIHMKEPKPKLAAAPGNGS